MKIIEAARITGYQSHEATNLNFSSGLNVIVGDTETGKSSILRALSFVLFNKPWHLDFITEEANETTVELRLGTDGHTNIITRRRSRDGKINDYIVDGCELSNFGRSVPVPVLEIIGVNNQLFDTIYAEQHDVPFLIGKGFSGTERARRLVAFSDVLNIDKAIKVATKRESEYTSEISALESQRDNRTEELSKLGDLIRLREIVEECETLDKIDLYLKGYESNELLLSKLLYNNHKNTLLLSKVSKYVEDSSNLQSVIIRSQIVQQVFINLKKLYQRKNFLEQALPLVSQIAKIRKYFDILYSIHNNEDSRLINEDRIDSLKKEIKKERIRKYLNTISNRISMLNMYKHELNNIRFSLINTNNELQEHLKENAICPLCNQKI